MAAGGAGGAGGVAGGTGLGDGGGGGGAQGHARVDEERLVHSLTRMLTAKTATSGVRWGVKKNNQIVSSHLTKGWMNGPPPGPTPEIAVARFLARFKENHPNFSGIIRDLIPRADESSKAKTRRSHWQQAREGLRSAAGAEGASYAGYGDDFGTLFDALVEFLRAWDEAEE